MAGVKSVLAHLTGKHAHVRPVPRKVALLGTAVVIAALVVLNLAKNLLPWAGVSVSVVAAAGLLLFARRHGLSWTQLGLGRDRLRSGALWGLSAIAIVVGIYVVGVSLPMTRSLFLDARYHSGVSQALLTAFVLIPLGTILLEEVAFRSVLWGMLSRHMTAWRVLLTSSALFGLWHVLPSLQVTGANQGLSDVVSSQSPWTTVLVVAGTVAFTAAGGIVAGELRRRSGSVLASAGMHWATNSLGVLFGLVAWQLAA
ncbi:membrane protease YdiL (CAAX protease family) [Saccharomonospora amisosensis]|uniref:Membrane protease YdiL (CAAX protease family) n=1 Tax=Saccharomonospora amisosensis TaxID=1128677 RepID=A0A7X5UQR8_9PSEU|nr:CPBP family intramembrane glutamic endopeptidase [Saccharomonospora amisosensis]NIJ12482.1 membrane protease YdiL (CAAX protease family) [Saccharomonospora amisosensis]